MWKIQIFTYPSCLSNIISIPNDILFEKDYKNMEEISIDLPILFPTINSVYNWYHNGRNKNSIVHDNIKIIKIKTV
jgi:hypothetical protein